MWVMGRCSVNMLRFCLFWVWLKIIYYLSFRYSFDLIFIKVLFTSKLFFYLDEIRDFIWFSLWTVNNFFNLLLNCFRFIRVFSFFVDNIFGYSLLRFITWNWFLSIFKLVLFLVLVMFLVMFLVLFLVLCLILIFFLIIVTLRLFSLLFYYYKRSRTAVTY